MIDFLPQTTTDPVHNGLPTIASPAVPLRVDILDRLQLLFERMVFHQEFLFFGCELRFPAGVLCPPGNCLFIAFEQRFIGTLRSAGLNVHYAWSRDQENSERNQRYSFIALVGAPPGGQLPSCLHLAESVWHGAILGTGHGLARPLAGEGILLHPEDPDFAESLGHAFRAASCLGRSETKRLAHPVNSFGSSRV